MRLDQAAMRAMRSDIETAIGAVSANNPHLASLKVGRGSYDPAAGSFSFKLEGTVTGGKNPDAARYEQSQKYQKRWPALGTEILWAAEYLTVSGMGKGGAIYVTGRNGKSYRIKRDQWERTYGGVFDSAPTRKQVNEELAS